MDKLDQIEICAEAISEQTARLIDFAHDENPEVRMLAVEALNDVTNDCEIKNCLGELLSDEDELVRVQCLEFIGDLRDIHLNCEVENLLNDGDALVRGVAAITLAKIGLPGAFPPIKEKMTDLESQLDDSVEFEGEWLRYCIALAMLEVSKPDVRKYYLDKAFICFGQSKHVQTRCATANLLVDCIDYLDSESILGRLRSALDDETHKVVRGTLSSAIDVIDKRGVSRHNNSITN